MAKGDAWVNRIVGYSEMAPQDLLANPSNPRTHPGVQMDALRGSLDELGWVAPILVNKRTSYVLDGHARVMAAMQRGAALVPVAFVDLSEDEERLALATLDPLSAMAGQDEVALQALLADVSTDNPALQALLDDLPGSKPKHTPGVEEVDLSDVHDTFWMSVHGPLPKQAESLERLRAALEDLGPDIQVEVGMTKVR